MRRNQVIAVLVTALASVSVLTGCGDDSDDSSSNSGATTTASTTAESGAGAAAGGSIDESKDPVVVALNALKVQAVDMLTPYEAGSAAAVKVINAAGGFGGRKLVVEACNTAYQPATATVCGRKALAKKPVASIGCEPTWASNGLKILAKAKIPSFNCPNGGEDYTNPYAIGLTQGTPGGQRAAARYLCSRDDVKSVTVLTQDIPFQRTKEAQVVTPVLKECGKSANYAFYPITGGDLLPHVTKAVKDKPDFVITLGGGAIAVQLFKLLGQSGIPADQVFASGNAIAYESVLKPAGAAMDGAYGTIEVTSWGASEDEGVAQYLKAMEGTGVDPRDSNPQTAFMYLMTIYTAAKEIGFDKFDSESLTKFMNTANAVPIPASREIVNPGPAGAPQVKQPYSQVVQWKDGKLNIVTEGTEEGWSLGF